MSTVKANIKQAASKAVTLPMTRGKKSPLVYVGPMALNPSKKYKGDDLSSIKTAKEIVKGTMLNLSLKKVLASVDTLSEAKIAFRDMIVTEFSLNKDKLERSRVIKDKIQEIKSLEKHYQRELMEVLNGYSFLIKNSIVITGDNLTAYHKWIDLVKMSKKVISTIEYGEKHSLKIKATKSALKKAVKAGYLNTYDYMEKVKEDFVTVANHKQVMKLAQLKNVFDNENKVESAA
jgi:hypothetical protein